MVLGGTVGGIGIAMTTAQGQRLWHFIQGSRVEIRKVVWPSRQETTQTAIAVFVFTLIMMLFFWLLDLGLFWLVDKAVGLIHRKSWKWHYAGTSCTPIRISSTG